MSSERDDGPVAVVIFNQGGSAIFGPDTELYYYETLGDAYDAWPDAIERTDVERGDFVDVPMICAFNGGDLDE